MANGAISARAGESAKNLAMINYGLLFSAVFFAGVPALIAAIIAYSQRDEAPPAIRSHHDFQIRIFWVAFVLALAAGASLLGAMINVAGELFQKTQIGGWNSFETVDLDLSRVSLDGTLVGLLIATGLFSLLGGLWLVAAPAIGFIRLASERGIGHSPAS
jgi:uncharacterized membrane protein